VISADITAHLTSSTTLR